MKLLYKLSNNQLLALSIGIIYIWFGTLKFFPMISPAEGLAISTISELTFGLIPQNISIILLALWEVSAGILLITGFYRRIAVLVLLLHMVFTFSPLILLPELVFEKIPFQLTLIGQYIFKNLIIIVGLLILLKKNQLNKYQNRQNNY